jgi:hypothetical protein
MVPVHVAPGATVDDPVIVDGTCRLSRLSAAATGAAAFAAGRGARVVDVEAGGDEAAAVVGDTAGPVVGISKVGTTLDVSVGVLVAASVVVVVVVVDGAAASVVALCTGEAEAAEVSVLVHAGVGTAVVVGTGLVVVVGATTQFCSAAGGSAKCCADAAGWAVAARTIAHPTASARRRISTDLTSPHHRDDCGCDRDDDQRRESPDPYRCA